MKKQLSIIKDSRAEAGAGAWLFVGIVLSVALLAGFGVLNLQGLQQAAPAAPGVFAPAPAAAPAAVSAVALTPAQMEAYNSQLTQQMDITFSMTDPTAGATVTTSGYSAYAPSVNPQDSNAPVQNTWDPGASNTNRLLMAGGYYKIVYVDGTNVYYPLSLCDAEGTKIVTACKVPVQTNPNIQYPGWGMKWNVKRVGALSDPIDENSATDSRNVNWANGQSNITEQWVGDPTTRCLNMGTGVAPGPTASETPADGDSIWFNDTACSGSFYIEFLFECSASANRWCYQPVLHFEDRHNNMSRNELSSLTLAVAQGGSFKPEASEVRDFFHQEKPIKFYSVAPASASWIQSTLKDFYRLTFSYTAANWGVGECSEGFLDDLGEHLGWLVNQTTTGSAAQSFVVCRRQNADIV